MSKDKFWLFRWVRVGHPFSNNPDDPLMFAMHTKYWNITEISSFLFLPTQHWGTGKHRCDEKILCNFMQKMEKLLDFVKARDRLKTDQQGSIYSFPGMRVVRWNAFSFWKNDESINFDAGDETFSSCHSLMSGFLIMFKDFQTPKVEHLLTHRAMTQDGFSSVWVTT